MKRTVATAATATALGACVAITGCSNDSSSSDSSKSGSNADKKTITVLAAASLTESFNELKAEFEKSHPGVKVETSYAASSTIIQQLSHGAPADIVALADEPSKDKLPADQAKGKTWKKFATNQLEIATPKGNPGKVKDLADLSKVQTVLCAAQVPCGRAADKALKKAKIKPNVVSYEKDVKATLAKVTTSDADAAVVYATDVKSAGDKVVGVKIPAGENVNTTLPITVWTKSKTAQEFEDLITGSQGQKVLQEKGFGLPK